MGTKKETRGNIIYDLYFKRLRLSVMADCVALYWVRGYTFWTDFKGEYFLMFCLETGHKVRLYYNDRAYETY